VTERVDELTDNLKHEPEHGQRGVDGYVRGEALGHAFKRCDRVDLHRARMCFGLDGVAFWRQLCAVPADDTALPRGARLFANAVSKPKRRAKWRLDLVIV
jgi:hypothetical protein